MYKAINNHMPLLSLIYLI